MRSRLLLAIAAAAFAISAPFAVSAAGSGVKYAEERAAPQLAVDQVIAQAVASDVFLLKAERGQLQALTAMPADTVLVSSSTPALQRAARVPNRERVSYPLLL